MKVHKSLPPAYLTNKDGLAVLSWRVCAAQFSHDNDLRRIDFSRPWNGPENASLVYFNYPFGYYNDLFHCPGSFEEPENPLTDYVAVVGPDTLWPGKTPGDLKTHPKAILVVEWPKSNIHWAEPRDISVEEFLEWFARSRRAAAFGTGFVRRRSLATGSIAAGCSMSTPRAMSANCHATRIPKPFARCWQADRNDEDPSPKDMLPCLRMTAAR